MSELKQYDECYVIDLVKDFASMERYDGIAQFIRKLPYGRVEVIFKDGFYHFDAKRVISVDDWKTLRGK